MSDCRNAWFFSALGNWFAGIPPDSRPPAMAYPFPISGSIQPAIPENTDWQVGLFSVAA
jgi:hypothetical protein